MPKTIAKVLLCALFLPVLLAGFCAALVWGFAAAGWSFAFEALDKLDA